jgi:hypothetical protein
MLEQPVGGAISRVRIAAYGGVQGVRLAAEDQLAHAMQNCLLVELVLNAHVLQIETSQKNSEVLSKQRNLQEVFHGPN